ncbi:MAG: hypothetical protein WCE81_10715 [Halobacteriota archaeon]
MIYFLREDEYSEIVKDSLDSKAVFFGPLTMYDEPVQHWELAIILRD